MGRTTDSNRRTTAEDGALGERIRRARELRGVSQEKLSAMLGLSFQQVQKYERAENRVSATRLVAIAKALAFPLTFFVDDGFEDGGEIPQFTPKIADLARKLERLDGKQLASVGAVIDAIFAAAPRTERFPHTLEMPLEAAL
jgi:transcriptional regulator with XRE-family HTH domain